MLFETPLVPIAAAVLISALAIPIELRSGHIPNGLTLGALVGAIVLAVVDRHPLFHVAGFALTFPVLAVYKRQAIGGGAVKLMAAASALGGPVVAVAVWLTFGGVYAMAALRSREPQETPSSPWICVGAGLAAALLGRVGWL